MSLLSYIYCLSAAKLIAARSRYFRRSLSLCCRRASALISDVAPEGLAALVSFLPPQRLVTVDAHTFETFGVLGSGSSSTVYNLADGRYLKVRLGFLKRLRVLRRLTGAPFV